MALRFCSERVLFLFVRLSANTFTFWFNTNRPRINTKPSRTLFFFILLSYPIRYQKIKGSLIRVIRSQSSFSKSRSQVQDNWQLKTILLPQHIRLPSCQKVKIAADQISNHQQLPFLLPAVQLGLPFALAVKAKTACRLSTASLCGITTSRSC